MSNKPTGKKVERVASLRWVPLVKTRVNPLAQRDLKQARVDELVSSFDLEQFGSPTVNHRDDHFNIVDGQHRITALKEWFGESNWEDQQIQCWTYQDLTDDEEAEVFLKLNNTLAVTAMSKFRVGVQAGRPEESDVDRVVRAVGLRVTSDGIPGAIHAVGTLMRVYRRSDAATLSRTLRIIRDAYGDGGLESTVIDGIGLLCHRYNGEIDDERLVNRLGGTRGGVNALLQRAEDLRLKTGNPKAHCIAAAAIDINNAGRGGKKMSSWWRES